MIIDFDFEPHRDTEFEPRPSAEDEKKWEQHQGKVINLLKHYEKKYGFERTGMTSWVKTSATAFLTPKQVDLLSKDKRVTLLTENSFDEFSAAPPWNNFLVGNEHRSWATKQPTESLVMRQRRDAGCTSLIQALLGTMICRV
jgi:hypothetical protein